MKLSTILLSLLLAATLFARIASAQIIDNIVVIGNQRVEKDTIFSYLKLRVGDEFSEEKLNESLKELFKTGLFGNIKTGIKDQVLILDIEENPIVNKVIFEGNKKLDNEFLASEISLKSRSVYTKSKIQNDLQKIKFMYRKSGRYSSEVEPKIVPLDQNRINLIFEIKEGKTTRVSEVYFVGNKAFSDKELKKEINTKETKWHSFYSGKNSFDQDKTSFDKELLRKFYRSKGYADFKVLSSTAELTENNKSFVLTFNLDEGEKYRLGEVDFNNSLKEVDTDIIAAVVTTKSKETYNSEKIDDSISNVTELLNDKGYAFVDVNADYDIKPESRIINIVYKISEAPKVYVDRININGNVRTYDEVIRREFRLGEGDPLNADKLRRSKQRIENLGFFEKVDFQTAKTENADQANINVEVQEKSTGELSFGAGFSSLDGALANVSIQERNLLGRGQNLRASVQRSQVGINAELGFTEPYFMGKDFAAGFDIWNNSSERLDQDVSSVDSMGLTLRGSYSLTEHLRHTLRYTIQQDEITNIRLGASPLITSQAGKTISSIIGQSFLYDRRNSRFNPTEGYFLMFDQRLAGLGGDLSYIRHEARAGYYQPLFSDDYILKFIASGGHIEGYSDEPIRYVDNFRLTGRVVRGFENIGFGPTDVSTNLAAGEISVLGGKKYAAFTAQLDFPLSFIPDELGFTGFIFHDMGVITGIDNTDGIAIEDTQRIHASAGLGFSWVSPLGPLNISYAFPYSKDTFTRTQKLQFDFGARF